MNRYVNHDDGLPFSGTGNRYLDLVPTPASPDNQYVVSSQASIANAASFDLRDLAGRYWLLLVMLVITGAAGGVTSIVFQSPVYKATVLLEVHGVNDAWLKNSVESASSYDANEVGIQTQIQLLRSGPFLRRVYSRLQSETVPLAPVGADIFSRLRQRVRPSVQDPLENVRMGLEAAFRSFDARPITRTRLMELTCDSTSPEFASQFVNTMANEFIEETLRARMQTSQKTTEWLTAQIEEIKTRLQEAEERLQEFVRSSGNLFVSQDTTTLEDAKLVQLRGELSRIQSERISKQTRYELVTKNPPEQLPQVLDDPALRLYQAKLDALRQDKAAMETTFTAGHPKIQKLDAQLRILETSLRNDIAGLISRIRNEYETALRQEQTLAAAYTSQSQRVTAISGKAANYSALRREVETLRQMYQSLLMQSNQAGLSHSVPINPIRLVDPSTPSPEPYKPKPVLNILFGVVLGLASTVGIIFLREKSDGSVRSPGISRSLFNAPELGVIPSASSPGLLSRFRRKGGDDLHIVPAGPVPAAHFWQGSTTMLAESFRGTLASLLRGGTASAHSAILVTSAGPGEGKTMITANLGIALAETGRRVLLIDADFRRPRLHEVFRVNNDQGTLLDLLIEETPVADYCTELLGLSTAIPGVTLLANRVDKQNGPNISRLLYSPRLPTLVSRLRDHFDYVIIDTPPILNLADARIVGRLADGVILVLRAGVTERAQALEACERIAHDGLTLIGTVLNDWNSSKSTLKHQYYYSRSAPDDRD